MRARLAATVRRDVTPRRVALWLACAGIAALTAVSFGGALYYPADVFSHFRLHLGAAGVVLTGLLLVSGPRSAAIVAAGVVVTNLLGTIPLRTVPVDQALPGDVEITIVTFNIWNHNTDPAGAGRALAATGADIILLQETGLRTRPVLEALETAYPFHHGCAGIDNCDLAIVSNQPWIEAGTVAPDGDHPSLLWARFERDGRRFTVATTHLNRPPSPAHLRQIDVLGRSLAGISRPVILGGDLNAAPWSHAMTRLIRSSRLAPLAGLRPTWPAHKGIAQLAIDHLLVTDGVRNLGATRLPFAGSDHLPVLARLAIGESAAGGP